MNFTFVKEMFTEEKDGKFSSKKLWGHIFLLLVGLAFVCDGLSWYEANKDLFNTMIIAGTTLIGLNTVRSFFSKKEK